uniref:ADP-ribosylation factor-like protein 6-interacting protein 4 n=1 Tax=Homalodisca liturata TaxID=320908 RepID=A0A1B6JCB1_9HEMI
MEGNSSQGKITSTIIVNKHDTSQNSVVTKKRKKSKKESKKRKYSSSSGESEDESSLKQFKTKHKKCKKRHKHVKDKKNKTSKLKDVHLQKCDMKDIEEAIIGPDIPGDLLKKAQSMAPMSKEEWEKQQNTIRRVYDEETGRTRLIRGEGEIIEEIVSRERHKEINRQATRGDGEFFQSNLKKWI